MPFNRLAVAVVCLVAASVTSQFVHAEESSNEPISITVSKLYGGGQFHAEFVSKVLRRPIEITWNLEQLLIDPILGASGLHPYAQADRILVDCQPAHVVAMLKGRFYGRDDLPYSARVTLDSERYRVRFVTEVLKWPGQIRPAGALPCIHSPLFRQENQPPFLMSKKSFGFFGDAGLQWLSDVQRTRSEWHDKYQGRSNVEGPWIQTFPVAKLAQAESAPLPLVGWVPDDRRCLIAYGADNGHMIGIRWGPCIHCDATVRTDADGKPLPMRSVLYLVPPELDLLAKLYREDFPDVDATAISVKDDCLWPLEFGALVDGFEHDVSNVWTASGSRLVPRKGKLTWIAGHLEAGFYAAGASEGERAAEWQAAAGNGTARLSRSVDSQGYGVSRVTHVAIDAFNRTKKDLDVQLFVEAGESGAVNKTFRIGALANRRLLLPLPDIHRARFETVLQTDQRDQPGMILLDDLRIFAAR